MPKVGIVYYADDPDKGVFRIVHPEYARGETEAVLDDPQWVTMGCDPSRTAILEKVEPDDQRAGFSGTV